MRKQEFTVITDLSQIPDFTTEQEEAAFWDTHTCRWVVYPTSTDGG